MDFEKDREVFSIQDKYSRSSSRMKLFNVLIMGFGFMFLFTVGNFQIENQGYNTAQNYLTRLLSDEGLGNLGIMPSISEMAGFYSLATVYAAITVSVFFSPIIVPKIGERGSMWIGALCFVYSHFFSLSEYSSPLSYTSSFR